MLRLHTPTTLSSETLRMIDEIQHYLKLDNREQVIVLALCAFRDWLAERGAAPLLEPLGEPPVQPGLDYEQVRAIALGD